MISLKFSIASGNLPNPSSTVSYPVTSISLPLSTANSWALSDAFILKLADEVRLVFPETPDW